MRPLTTRIAWPRAAAGSLLVLLCLSGHGATLAQIPSAGVDDPEFRLPADPRWRSIAAADVDAAYQLLRDNHPGAAAELHDTIFVKQLHEAHARALMRARTVSSYPGYLAVLAGFATDMGDKHIWSRPTFVVNLPRWPGMLVSKRGSTWVVTDAEEPQQALLGATLLSCDGVEAQELARRNLGGFRAVWSIGAQQIQSAPWLLVDEGNPFITRPHVCELEHGGQRTTISLKWDRIKRENLLPRIQHVVGAGAAGWGVRAVGAGYWIALQELETTRALAVVKSVEEQKSALREARFVVLDLRGNRGGSSEMGRRIAAALLGQPFVDARLLPVDADNCGASEVYRASKGNLAQLEFVRNDPFVVQGSPEIRKLVEREIAQVRGALAEGRALSAPVACHIAPPRQATANTPSLLEGSLILLTDNLCFSSCLAVADDFRTLGAFHVGETTDAATWYVDVREQYMPSGYSLFSTLEAVSGDQREVGPFVPTLTYEGDIADTAALERWISGPVLERLHPER
jgi:hypothetical protein